MTVQLESNISNCDEYLKALDREFEEADVSGTPFGVVIRGGGDWGQDRLHTAIRIVGRYVRLNRLAVETDPRRITTEELGALAGLGVSRVIFRLDGFREEAPELSSLARRVFESHKMGMDTCVVLDSRNKALIRDAVTLLQARPRQVLVDQRPPGALEDLTKAAKIFGDAGYVRRSPWSFALSKEADLFEPYRETLGIDHFGFGAGAASFIGKRWQVNNPGELYLRERGRGLVQRRGFDQWSCRRMARMLGSLEYRYDSNWPLVQKWAGRLLCLEGYRRGAELTPKGIALAAELVRTHGEPRILRIVNERDYLTALEGAGDRE